MNFTKYIFSAIALFIFIFLYEMFVHGYLFMGMYEATANVWRDFADMEANLPLAVCFQLALAAWSAFMFAQFYPEGGIKNGLRFGVLVGVLIGILSASWYLWLNVPATLGFTWFISGIVEGVIGGLVLGSIYQNGRTA